MKTKPAPVSSGAKTKTRVVRPRRAAKSPPKGTVSAAEPPPLKAKRAAKSKTAAGRRRKMEVPPLLLKETSPRLPLPAAPARNTRSVPSRRRRILDRRKPNCPKPTAPAGCF